MKRLLLSLFVLSAATSAIGQAFKEDISDVKIYPKTVGSITPIGDLGDIEKIVDHRGFFPYSFKDNKKSSLSDSGYSWFKVALIPAIAQAYYLNPYANVTEWRIFKQDRDEQDKLYATNTAKHKVFCEKLAKVPVQKEDSLDDESKKWAKLAYNLSNERGKDFYDKIGSGVLETFVGCEPVCILFTSHSAFVFLNFRCNGLGMEDVGQILVAMEFSRNLGDYKSFYLIYTNMLRRSTADTFSSTSSVVVPVAKILLDLNGAASSKK